MAADSPELINLYQRFTVSQEKIQEPFAGFSAEELLLMIESSKMWVGAAHDLKNQFGIVMGYLDYLEHHTDMNENQREKVRVVVNTLCKSQKILEQTIHIMRGGKPCREKVLLHEILEEALSEVMKYKEFGMANLKIEKNLDPALPPINADPTQMGRVFFNLTRNAAQAMKESGIGDSIKIASYHNRTEIHVSLSDNGPGLPDSVLEHLGQPFLTTRRAKGGSGLGLIIVRQIVKAHGGTVKMRNFAHVGAEFLIALPLL